MYSQTDVHALTKVADEPTFSSLDEPTLVARIPLSKCSMHKVWMVALSKMLLQCTHAMLMVSAAARFLFVDFMIAKAGVDGKFYINAQYTGFGIMPESYADSCKKQTYAHHNIL